MSTCKHCARPVELTDEGWVDPEATGDDSLWYFVCDENETFPSEHEVWDITEYSCDRCGVHTENGNGHYLDELGSDDRVCSDCYKKAVQP